MAIKEHPQKGSILLCDFMPGFQEPEMVKRRPVIVISPKIESRVGLCTVVGLSMTPPTPPQQYHAQIDIHPPLPDYYESTGIWIKGDMVYAVSFERLNFLKFGKKDGKRVYYYNQINPTQLKLVQSCVLRAMGLSSLTKHL